MARDLTASFITEIDGNQLSPALLVKFEFASGDVRFWTGYGSKTYNSEEYTGIGDVMGVSTVEEVQDIRATSVTFTLSGLNSSVISAALQSQYQGRAVTMWFAVLDSSGALIADPYELFSGRMDVISFSDNGDAADFAIKCESNAIDIRKAKERRFTPEDQKIDYPSDKGLDYIPKIQDIDVVWG